ncbi:hypothetical protein DHD05_21310 [Arenibacter sp. N53]|uniref:DUF6747 family protein n=1 Tax=Arenibacter TaxID=178469 RepID=UPI000CD41665|nr:hypothetical protein [Arenibacter sp. N53]
MDSNMAKALLIKKVYSKGFKSLWNQLIKNGFKIYFWIYTLLFVMVLNAFADRFINGFIWD